MWVMGGDYIVKERIESITKEKGWSH
jgi:hypothetical protein